MMMVMITMVENDSQVRSSSKHVHFEEHIAILLGYIMEY